MMPQPDAGLSMSVGDRRLVGTSLWFCLVLVLLASGCSRLTFIRPDLGDVEYERVAPEINVSDGAANRKSSKASLLVREGQRHFATGDVDAAGKAAEQALKLDDASDSAHTLMAMVDDRRGRSKQAGGHYHRAVELAPQGSNFNNYGIWLCNQGRAAESLEWFDRALQDRGYPTPAFALTNAGACADKAGLDERAGNYLQAAIKLDPDNPTALATLAEREFRAGRPFQARAFSERRLAAAPADARSLVLASQIEQKLGDTEAAARYVQRLRAEFPAASGSDMGDDGRR
jgi:type IV pilus assembly protein PilF